MKRCIIATLSLFVFLIPCAFAKTEGSYLEVDYIRSKEEFYERAVKSTKPMGATSSRFSHDHGGWGLNYKYAFNVADSLDCLCVEVAPSILEKVFIAPGLIFEVNNVKARSNNEKNSNTELTVKNRYGAKLDIGYDVHDRFAPYFTFGYVGIHYKTINSSRIEDNGETKTANLYDWFYGGGFKVDYNKEISLNFEYNKERFRAKTTTDGYKNYTALFISRLEVFKIGVSYRF